jgi:AraC-like DNA-binding protein
VSVLFPGIADSLNIRLLSAGWLDLGDWWERTDTLRDFWRLYLNDREGAKLALEASIFKMPRKRIVLVPAGIEFQPKLDSPVRQLFVHFEFVGWPADAAQQVFPAPFALKKGPLRDQLANELCTELAAADSTLEPMLASRLKALIHLSISAALAEIPEDRTSRFLRIAEGQQELLTVLHYIEEHLDGQLSNAQLAEIARSSESRFIRRFREVTGRTPGRYVQDRRLRRAADALISTDRSIEEIAQRCGFANRYHFTRAFSQRMGCPPARYRSDRPYGPTVSAKRGSARGSRPTGRRH